MKIVDKKINELIPYENNPRLNDEAVDYVANSIKEFGFKVPIVIDKNNVIVAGHTRLKASKKLGLDKVPCIIADDLNEEQIKAFRLADNKVSEKADWDFNMLDDELKDIDINMEQFGFDEVLEIEEQEIIEDEVPEVPEEPKAKYGDIYQLGRHFLMCGDSTSEEDVAKLMNGIKADMVFTDPPYGMKKENDGVANDNLNYDDLLEFNKKWIPITFNNLKDNGSWYCWGIDEPLMDIYSNILKPMAKQKKITFRNLITWDKDNGQGQLSSEFRMYPIADEKCLFVVCGDIKKDPRTIAKYNECFEPIRKWFEVEKNKSGLTTKQLTKIDSTRVTHYWAKNQTEFPIRKAYLKIQKYCFDNNINAFTEDYDVLRTKYEELKKIYNEHRKEFQSNFAYFDNTHDNMNNVWHFSKTSGEERESAGRHATPKPIALCTRAIKSSSRENENVLDVFGGSGSTLIACEQNNRNCYTMELEPKWVDVIIQRWENFTGKKAIKL